MSIKFKLKAQFDILAQHIQLLKDEIKLSEVVLANYYQLPDFEKSFESKAPDTISVNKLTGDKAQKSILNAYSDFFLKSGQSGKVLNRHPGLLVVNDNNSLLEQRLKQINFEKQQFKELILTIDNNDARFDAVHSAIPNLVTLAAYRKIHFETQPPYSLRFTWMKKHSTKILTRDDALHMLERSSRYSNPRVIDQENWKQVVEQERVRVASLSSKSKLRIRRPTRVSPEVNIRFSASNRYHVSGALPFILLNPGPDVKIGELNNYDANIKDPRKRDYQYLVDRIYLEKSD